MKHSVVIKAENSPELLERLLRVCRHRGFKVENIQGGLVENGKFLHLTLSVCSERPIRLLSKQLEKLFAVTQVITTEQELAIKVSA